MKLLISLFLMFIIGVVQAAEKTDYDFYKNNNGYYQRTILDCAKLLSDSLYTLSVTFDVKNKEPALVGFELKNLKSQKKKNIPSSKIDEFFGCVLPRIPRVSLNEKIKNSENMVNQK